MLTEAVHTIVPYFAKQIGGCNVAEDGEPPVDVYLAKLAIDSQNGPRTRRHLEPLSASQLVIKSVSEDTFHLFDFAVDVVHCESIFRRT